MSHGALKGHFVLLFINRFFLPKKTTILIRSQVNWSINGEVFNSTFRRENYIHQDIDIGHGDLRQKKSGGKQISKWSRIAEYGVWYDLRKQWMLACVGEVSGWGYYTDKDTGAAFTTFLYFSYSATTLKHISCLTDVSTFNISCLRVYMLVCRAFGGEGGWCGYVILHWFITFYVDLKQKEKRKQKLKILDYNVMFCRQKF